MENREQLACLRNYGCDLIQGYYYSRPLSEEEFYSYLSCNRIADSASIAGRKNHSHHLNGGAEISVTVSIGYTSKPDEYQNMIRMADKAMYRAKADGKNRAACLD